MRIGMTEPTPEQPKHTRITIDLPKDLKPVYANVAFINYTPAEMVLDFAQVLPRTPRGPLAASAVLMASSRKKT